VAIAGESVPVYRSLRIWFFGRFAEAVWQAWRNRHAPTGEQAPAYRLLVVWLVVYLVAFSAVATKLPHYIAPAYPPLAILTAAAIVRWMRGEVQWPRWGVPGAALGLFATGFLLGVAMVIAGVGEQLGIPRSKMRFFPGLESWAWLGLFPMIGAVAMIVHNRRGNRHAAVASFAISTILFIGLAAAFPPIVIDRYKAAKDLVAESGARQLDREVMVASLDYSQPSVTFYAGRAVRRIWQASEVNDLLASPIPLYLFMKAESLEEMQRTGKITQEYRIAARRYDFYRNREIVVITNR
jgi:4-amino-4-deoxy-L-arabinose transferase-like glycosyltransferase